MQLSWSDPAGVADALLNTYPDTDRQTISLEDLRLMVLSLPEFDDEPLPPKLVHLESILWNWMRKADEPSAIPEEKGAAS